MMINRKLKTTVAFFLIVMVLWGTIPFSASASSPVYYDFANFTEEDSMDFVEEHNIEIPTKLMQLDDLPAFTQGLILQSYNRPDIEFCFNYSKTQAYAEAIRIAVRSHMNLSAVPEVAQEEIDELQYNTVKNATGNWVTNNGAFDYRWEQYNCYAYAINRQERSLHYATFNFIPYAPGDMSDSGSFETITSIFELAQIVKEDLLSMNYTDVSISSAIPTINSSQDLICVRMNNVDYHFMRYDLETNAWYHKPGNTAVLKYNYIPSSNALWYSEVSFWGNEYSFTDIYDSEIMYIKYSKKQINIDTDAVSREFIQADKDILCELNFENTGLFDFHINSQNNVNYEVYDENFRVVFSGLAQTLVTQYFQATAGKYYLRMNFSNTEVVSYVDISIEPHSQHSYTTCEYLNRFSHNMSCFCGATQIANHYVDASSIQGGRYATCLGCNRLLDLETDHADLIMSITQVSVNGSYILPNGIVVLVEEDVEAYLAGTLQFYHPEDVPVTQ